jgi:hypothetical protein
VKLPAAGRARARALLTGLALAAPLVLGLVVHRDYGLPWDEPIQRTLGRQAVRYALSGHPAYLSNADRHHGPAFEMTLFLLERSLGVEGGDAREAFFLRHLLTFVAFWAAAVCLFDLVRRHLASAAMGLVAVALLFTSPRLFADAFYNTKDAAFLSFFVVAVWTLDRYVAKPGLARAAVHGLACGYATDVRVAGLLLPALTVLALAVTETGRGAPGRSRRLASVTAFAAAGGLAIIAFWPLLWTDPLGRVGESVRLMAHYPWDGEVLFAGRVLRARQLPWSYAPVWIAVTTPLPLLAFAALGLAAGAWSLRPGTARLPERRARTAVVIAWLATPLATAALLGSVLYDGWRQLYFVHPAVVFLAAVGVDATTRARAGGGRRAALATAALALLGVGTISTAAWMVRWHPHQNVYFNAAAGGADRVASRFDVEYWGLGCRRLLERVAAADRRPRIALFAATPPCWTNVRMLEDADRRRFVRVDDPAEADYVVRHYRRLVPSPPAEALPTLSVRVDGLLVATAQPAADRTPAAGP